MLRVRLWVFEGIGLISLDSLFFFIGWEGRGMGGDSTILSQLMVLIEDRREKMPPDSYTTRLLEGDLLESVARIGAKIREEADELIEAAAVPEDRAHVVHEAADLVFHLLVMLARCDVPLADVEAELARRFGTSGLQEKASRTKNENDGGP